MAITLKQANQFIRDLEKINKSNIESYFNTKEGKIENRHNILLDYFQENNLCLDVKNPGQDIDSLLKQMLKTTADIEIESLSSYISGYGLGLHGSVQINFNISNEKIKNQLKETHEKLKERETKVHMAFTNIQDALEKLRSAILPLSLKSMPINEKEIQTIIESDLESILETK